jgi:excisionase family DNA binding protein
MPKTNYKDQYTADKFLTSLFGKRATISIEEAAKVLGIGRNLAFEMAKNGRLPTLLVGLRRRIVPVAALIRLLESAGTSDVERIDHDDLEARRIKKRQDPR